MPCWNCISSWSLIFLSSCPVDETPVTAGTHSHYRSIHAWIDLCGGCVVVNCIGHMDDTTRESGMGQFTLTEQAQHITKAKWRSLPLRKWDVDLWSPITSRPVCSFWKTGEIQCHNFCQWQVKQLLYVFSCCGLLVHNKVQWKQDDLQ